MSCTGWSGLRETAQHGRDLLGPGSELTRGHLHSAFRIGPPEKLKEPSPLRTPGMSGQAWGPPGVGGIAEPGPELQGQCRLRCRREPGLGAGLRAQEAVGSPVLGAPGPESPSQKAEDAGSESAVGLFPGGVSGQERREGGRLV